VYNYVIDRKMRARLSVLFMLLALALWAVPAAAQDLYDVEDSTHLAPQGDNHYDVARLFDDDPSTAWVEGSAGSGIGDYILFTFVPAGFHGSGVADLTIRGLRVINGYGKNPDVWAKNGRVASLRVIHNGVDIGTVRLADSMQEQWIPMSAVTAFGDLDVSPGDTLKLVIAGVYPGTAYRDTALSELTLVYDVH
jgi:hypothetical protein